MKIIHIALASSFTEGLLYQDNLLANQNIKDGHEVIVISNCNTYDKGVLVDVPEEDTILENGIRLIRLKYKKIINNFISSKIRATKGLFNILEDLMPDVIIHHGLNDWEIITVKKFKKSHPDVKFYCDSHADYFTSATNSISLNILHKVYYRLIISSCIKEIDKIFYISMSCKHFLKEVYKIPDTLTDFLPLGGDTVEDKERKSDALRIRKELGLDVNSILILHGGKLDVGKKTVEFLKNFTTVAREDIQLVLIGNLDHVIEKEVNEIVSEKNNINYLGWKNGQELKSYLNAADLYIQPGKVSALAQNAICSGCALILNNLEDNEYLISDNGFLINSVSEIREILSCISKEQIEEMKNNSTRLAKEQLNYSVIAKKIYC